MFRHLVAAALVLASTAVLAQDKPKGVEGFNEFNAKPLEGWVWDEDERLQDLIKQLQEKELSLQAIDAAIAKATGRKANVKMAENMAWRSTQRMDLNGGGPIRWDAFYGRNAENFFYHPKDPNTTYHTATVLRQTDPATAGGVPGNQGVPAHQRPPQFDFIYRGFENAQAKAREEAKAIADKIEVLKFRREQYEKDVVVLWTKLAFRVIDKDRLPDEPALRFAYKPRAGGEPNAHEQALVLTSATQLVATAMLFNETLAEESLETAFRGVSDRIKRRRQAFEDDVFKAASLREAGDDKTTSLGQFKILSRKLEDTANLLSEGYQGWQDGDANEDEPTKYGGLRRVQDGVVRYSKILLALNELVGQMTKQWAVDLDMNSPDFKTQRDVAYVPSPIPPAPPQALIPVRITYRYAADGTTTTTARRIAANASDGPARSKEKIAPGVWRFTHVFRDESSLEGADGPMKLDRVEGRVELDPERKALVFPTGIHGAIWYPGIFRGLPVTVEADLATKNDQVALFIGINDTRAWPKQNVQTPFLLLKTWDGFNTIDILDRLGGFGENGQELAPTELAHLRRAPTGQQVICKGVTPLPKPESFYWLHISNAEGIGCELRRLSVEGRVGPVIGVALMNENGVVVANVGPGPAEQAGVQKGDRILSIKGRRPTSVENATDLIRATDFGETWRLEVERDGKRQVCAIRNRD